MRGSEYFTIRVRDWSSGVDSADVIEETDGGVVWSADSKSFFYVKLDDNHRPMQVFRHRLGTTQSEDKLVYEEKDSGWFTHIHESASGRFCVIAGGDHETSEQRLIDLHDPDAKPRIVAAREEGVQYSVNDRGDQLFILTNADGERYALSESLQSTRCSRRTASRRWRSDRRPTSRRLASSTTRARISGTRAISRVRSRS